MAYLSYRKHDPFSFTSCLALLASLMLGGCGDVHDVSPSATIPNASVTANLLGSYTLTFNDVIGGPNQPNTPASALLNQAVRIDIRENAASPNSFEAVLTPDGYSALAYAAQIQNNSLILTGEIRISVQTGCALAADKLQNIEIPLGTDGKLGGTFTASGVAERIAAGDDVIQNGPFRAAGVVERDQTAPRAIQRRFAVVAPEVAMPWETLEIFSNEPVKAAGLLNIGISPNNAAVVPLGVTPPASGTEWAGTQSARFRLQAWPEEDVNVAFQLPQAGLEDLAGNSATAAPILQTIAGLRVPKAAFSFDTAAAEVRLLGDTSRFYSASPGTTDPHCESGGCIALGSETLSQGPQLSGFAGQISVGAHQLRVRYRILRAAVPAGYPSEDYTPFTLYTAVLGQSAELTLAPKVQLADLGASAGVFRYASEWVESTFVLPPSATPVGFAISAVSSNLNCFLPTANRGAKIVIIDSISSE